MAVKRLKLLLATLVYCLGFCLLNVGLASADSRPYFRVYGGDVATGGWFNSGTSSCNPSDSTYQAPDYTKATNLYSGGIMTYGSYDSGSQLSKGSGSVMGAVSLGLIEGASSGEPYGFSTGTTGYNTLSFANKSSLTANNYWGGFLEGSVRQTHCVPDYFGTLQNSPTTVASAPDVSTLNSGQFLISAGGGVTTVGSSAPIPAGKKITVFVDGNAYISSNITYAAHNETNTPKFALVAKGSIYVAPSVGELDGLYIAQPNPSAGSVVTADTGDFWTCHDNTTTIPTDSYISANCRSKLTVNGSVIAKQVNLFRVNGDIASAPTNEQATSPNISEDFNFTPEMVVGGGFFNSTTGSSGKIESLISLPPVF